jgi:hypothetical protein
VAAAYRWLAGIEGVQELRCTSSLVATQRKGPRSKLWVTGVQEAALTATLRERSGVKEASHCSDQYGTACAVSSSRASALARATQERALPWRESERL